MSLVGLTLFSTRVAGQSVNVEGLINARNGDTIILKTSDSPHLVLLLTNSTDVAQVQGVLKARKKEMLMAALIPGLPVKVEGTCNDKNELVAGKIRFKGNDLKQAQDINAGMHETKEQVAQQNEALKKQQGQLSEQQAAISAAVARFGQLDDY